ncbi:MAG: glycerophosphodiester phosphodiesterase family protein [Sphingomonas sp.]|uniref:glycerophosphodiester phosphodiesterase family protein n=2 Tax=Alphaproteobacteria TaxID=28211 RepID=UPI00257DFC33|nr:glycerophosphodiester phosphodiesterase family protein [Sphingomonas sp.]MBQ1480850.1 glycerophosphodiester phosphodiesterase family protein [Sphingomonas sp.]
MAPPGARSFVAAHRGAHVEVPENSVPAIRRAIELGVDIVEIDVRFTRDNVAVLMHDPKVDRTTTGQGKVESMTFAEIERLRLLGPDGKPTAYRVPTLDSVLRIARDKIVVDLHLKVDRAPEVAAILRRAGIRHALFYADDALWLENMQAAWRGGETLRLAQSAEELDAYLKEASPRFVHLTPDYLSRALIVRLDQRGVRGMVNVLGDPDRAAAADGRASYDAVINSGVSIIQTDRPKDLIERMTELGRHRTIR